MRPIRKSTIGIIIHCSASSPKRDIGAADIDIEHKARGWDSIGYHFVVRRNGRIEVGEDLKREGAHAKGYNDRTIAVCMVGGIDEKGASVNNFTPAQWASLKQLALTLKIIYPEAKFAGHRDLSPDRDGNHFIDRHEFIKDCPCFNVDAWVKSGFAAQTETFPAPKTEPAAELGA